MTHPPLRVLYEDNHLLAIDKTAALPTMGVPVGTTSLVDLAKSYIKQKYDKRGNVFLGVVSRLDAPVTGVVLFARTSKAASRLSQQFRGRTVEKIYWTLVEEGIAPLAGELVHWLKKHERHRKVLIADEDTPSAQEAKLRYARLGSATGRDLLEVNLLTGRKHQIRVQLAAQGHPIVGDRKYGSQHRFPHGIALHSRRLVIRHPTTRQRLEIVCPVPEYWPRFTIKQCGRSHREPPTSST